MEGFLLFVALVIVFDRAEEKKWTLFAFGYGFPALLAGIPLAVALGKGDDYIREDACWLDGNYIWAFIAPVTLVLIFNTGMLIKALWTAYQVWLSHKSYNRSYAQHKHTPLRLPRDAQTTHSTRSKAG